MIKTSCYQNTTAPVVNGARERKGETDTKDDSHYQVTTQEEEKTLRFYIKEKKLYGFDQMYPLSTTGYTDWMNYIVTWKQVTIYKPVKHKLEEEKKKLRN